MQRLQWVSWLVGGLLLMGCGRQAAAPAQEATVAAPADAPAATEPAVPTETPAEPTATPVASSPAAAPASPLSAPISPLPGADQPAGADDATFTEPDWFAVAATYTDEQAGFELRYPAEWTLLDVSPEVRESSTNYAITINSWEEPAEGGSGGIPVGQTKLDILVARTDAAALEEVVEQRRAELTAGEPPAQIVEEETWTLADGQQAHRWTVQGEQGNSYELIALFDGWTVILAGLGDEQRFDEVARTLRPLAQ